MLSTRLLIALVATATVGALPPIATAAPATISPSHVAAGSTTTISIHASGCSSSLLKVTSPVIGGSVYFFRGTHPAHVFAGHVHVPGGTSAGAHFLSLRCSGANYGSVKLTVTHHPGSTHHGSTGHHAAPAGTLIARIGWHYDDDILNQSHLPNLKIHWGSCVKAGGTVIYFPKHKHLIPVSDPRSEKLGFIAATLSGPVLDPADPFNAHLYVGDLAHQTGITHITLKCMHRVHGHLHKAFSGQLPIKYVRHDNNFDPAGNQFAMPEFGFPAGTVQTVDASNIACGEAGTHTLTYTSNALAPNAAGQHSVKLVRTAGTLHSNKEVSYRGTVKMASNKAAGHYKAIVRCGTGRVGVGTIAITPF